jgi:hypothetical protein
MSDMTELQALRALNLARDRLLQLQRAGCNPVAMDASAMPAPGETPNG